MKKYRMHGRHRLLLIAAAIWLPLTGMLASPPAPAAKPSERAVAVTMDDLPVISRNYRSVEAWEEITARILEAFRKENVPAVGFVNEAKCFTDGRRDPGRVALLERWLEGGLELGNHTFSHPSLHRVSLKEYEKDLVKGERVLKKLLGARGQELRYFRHPYLHTGTDLETKRKFESYLETRGYTVAPVTIDNSEWMFAFAYDQAAHEENQALMARIGREYLAYMDRMSAYYERQSAALFGREIRQILLIHANLLNAHFLDELLAMLKDRGYRFITLEEALEDPAYESEDTFTGNNGITWIHRWALTRGKKRPFFGEEPEVPAFIRKGAEY